jgi:adenylate kinase
VKRVVLLGPPASGKGTQGKRLARALEVPHVSTGSLLRRSMEAGDPHGIRAVVERGDPVPEDVVQAVMLPALADGFVLDGFPRTEEQAARLDQILAEQGRPVEAVIELDVDDATLAARMGLRAREEHRSDDRPDVFLHRLEVYRREEPAIRRHYDGLVVPVDAHGDEDEVFERMMAALRERDPR